MAGPQPAPLIAVTGGDRSGHAPRRLVTLALWLAGARTVSVTPSRPRPELEPDAVVVTGGHDVDPVLYAAAPEVQPRYDRARDRLESDVIDRALALGLPLLGICRGAQLLNVRLGGSLYQELRSRRRRTSNRWTIFPLKTLCVAAGSGLEVLLRTRQTRINSLHNQGIDRLGEGLAVAGRDLDDIVQAVEQPSHPFLLGVQWHPEFLLYKPSQLRLFRALVEAARVRRATLAE
ncbi:MAG: gamma-glutamyl-gamma-aminobutyrate hydrolase family protein [Thiohalocapsa sp.]|uniref:gamma-glutamyl-gamma-aminobutyrate hydrolase family protein n=1 Tax=Thiohalocapsa sp. TaxID=2497641 RepID=UPI0025D8CBB2|nr:gamma-glutamyl-gamma-aminobutyrate hydrolase family protein [Thiohalocapsa sp.]MCG6943574.1 gamma-glutamyl-gamma-aminobutyrate hydrolase family protein [Thiohalocapsa sp.]